MTATTTATTDGTCSGCGATRRACLDRLAGPQVTSCCTTCHDTPKAAAHSGAPVAPTAGLGATIRLYSDTTPAVVTRVNAAGTVLWIRRVEILEATREQLNPGADWPIWTAEGDLSKPIGDEERYSLRKDGRWLPTGGDGSISLRLGKSIKYTDYHV